MQYIKKLFKKKNIIFLTILICFLADTFFFYFHGFIREHYNNLAYINFIDNFPKIIASARVEPIFVIVSVFLAKLIGSKLVSIIILKNLLIILQLFVFYKIANLFLKNEYFSSLAVIFLNFSFAFFSLTDNLLRNNTGNLFFLISLYFILKIFSGKTEKSNIAFASFFGGLVIYAHILPTVILDFSLAGIMFFLSITWFFQKYNQFKNKLRIFYPKKNLLKPLLLTTLLIFIIQAPYITRMVIAHNSINDYKINEHKENATTHKSISQPQTQKTTHKSISQPQTQKTINNIKALVFKIFRIIFEYRLPGFSIFMIFLVFVSIIILFKRFKFDSPEFPLIIVWIVTYAGSKSDLLFGIGTLPYRFSLMLIFPSVLLVFLLIKYFLEKIKNLEGKVFFSLIILISFLATNLPIIVETSILKNYNNNTQKENSLKQIYKRAFPKKERQVFLINGDSFENFDNTSSYIRNNSIFSTNNEYILVNFMKQHNVNYIIFDVNRINQKGNDLEKKINTNLDTLKTSPYFRIIGQYTSDYGINIIIFQFVPSGNISKNIPIFFDCSNNKKCVKNFSATIKKDALPIESWNIEINDNKQLNVTEYVFSKSGRNYKISYTLPRAKQDILFVNSFITLKDIPIREKLSPTINIHIQSAVFLLNSQNIKINYINLEKLAINQLTVSGSTQSRTFRYYALTRKGFRLLIHIFSLTLIIIIYIAFLFYRKIRSAKKNVLEFQSKISVIIILSIVAFLIVDILFGNMLFLIAYKKIIGV